MYEEQEDDFLHVRIEDQFVIHPPTKDAQQSTNNTKKAIESTNKVIQKCYEIADDVMEKKVEQFTDTLVGLIQDNFKKEKESSKPKNESRDKWKLIFPITLKKNQEDHLKKFIKRVVKKVQEIGEIINEQDEEQIQDESQSKYNLFRNSRKINIMKADFNEIRTIALRIHQRYKSIQVENDLMIYLSEGITNLSPANSYIFEQGLNECNCMLILPTYSNFELYNYYSSSKIEVIPFKLFNAKELFCEVFYRCICDSQIMAYLPAQSVQLISDFDVYPISFNEGVRRLVFCLQKMFYLLEQKKVKFEFVDISGFFSEIDKAIKRTFKIFYEKQTLDKNIKIILNQEAYYNPFDRFLNKIDHFKYEDGGCKDENEVMKKVAERLIRYFQKNQNLKEYAEYFNPEVTNAGRKRRNANSAMDRYQINMNLNESFQQKNFVEKNLTLVIKNFTKRIRDQASRVKWQDIQLTERIRPMVPYDIHESVMQSKPHADLLNFIEDKSSISLARIIKEFCVDGEFGNQSQMKYGELMYYLKDLELYGLIDIVYRSLTPKVSPAFFPKAKYAGKNLK